MDEEQAETDPELDPARPPAAQPLPARVVPPEPGLVGFVGLFAGLPAWVSVLGGLLTAALLAGGLVLLYVGLGDFLLVLLLALIVGYLLDPVIDRLEQYRINRSLAILASLGAFLGLLALTLLLLVPYVAHEIGQLSGRFDQYVDDAIDWIGSVQAYVEAKTGVELGLQEQLQRLPGLLQGVSPDALDPVRALLAWTVGGTARVLGNVLTWSLFPIFAFFFLRDFDEMKAHAFELLPFRMRGTVLSHYVEIDGKIAAFIRGQVLVAVILAALYSLGLLIFTGIDLALLIGVLAGLLFVVPYLGTVLGIALGTLMALLKFGLSWEVVKVWLVFGGVQALEGGFLTPKIVGDSVGLHPVTVMVSLLVGASLFGILGMLLAVPVAAALSVIGGTAVRWYKGTEWFQVAREGAPTGDDLP